MTNKQTAAALTPEQIQYAFSQHRHDDEIDLRELFWALWQGKWWIILTTLAFAAGATIYAQSQPNVYEASVRFMVEPDPFGIAENEGNNIGGFLTHRANVASQDLTSSEFTQRYTQLNEAAVLPSVSKDKAGIFTAKTSSTSPDAAYTAVLTYATSVNPLYKELLLDPALIQLSTVKKLSETSNNQDLAKRYANELIKVELLQNPDFKLIKLLSEPVKPTAHVKPKRLLIAVLGTLLGGMLGVAIVLVRFAFRKEN